MAEGIKISALPAAESAAAEDVVAGVQNNTTKKFSLATILAFLQSAFSIGSGTKTGLTGILKGNGTTVGTATAGTDYQAAITAQGVLVGAGSGSVSSKTLDDSSLTNDNDHIPTSGVVKSALTFTSLGSFSTLAELNTALDTVLASMDVTSPKYVITNATAAVAPFANNYYYKGTLMITGVNYASCILEPMGARSPAVLCRRSLIDGWTYQAIATSADVDAIFENHEDINLGQFTTLADLGSKLDAQLAVMASASVSPVRVQAGAAISPFGNSVFYSGVLSKTSDNYASVLLTADAWNFAVICRRGTAGWDYKQILPAQIVTIGKSASRSFNFSLYAQAIVFVVGYRDASTGAYLLCRSGNSTLLNVPLSAASNITISINSDGVVTIANADTISSVNMVLTQIQGTITEAT